MDVGQPGPLECRPVGNALLPAWVALGAHDADLTHREPEPIEARAHRLIQPAAPQVERLWDVDLHRHLLCSLAHLPSYRCCRDSVPAPAWPSSLRAPVRAVVGAAPSKP